jgi:hypothetical protein
MLAPAICAIAKQAHAIATVVYGRVCLNVHDSVCMNVYASVCMDVYASVCVCV